MKKDSVFFILLLTFSSAFTFFKIRVVPEHEVALLFWSAIIDHSAESPYAYRIIIPYIADFFGLLDTKAHLYIFYSFFLLIVFGGIYMYLYRLGMFFLDKDRKYSMFALFLFNSTIVAFHASFTVGDYLELLIFLMILHHTFSSNYKVVLFLLLVGVFNRFQTFYFLFFILFYFVSLNSPNRFSLKLTKQQIIFLTISLISMIGAFILLRYFMVGSKENYYTFLHHVTNNTNIHNLLKYTLPLWGGFLVLFIIISVATFKKYNLLMKYYLLLLIPYTFAFFLKGNMWELAKYYPAYVILSIAFLSYTRKYDDKVLKYR